MSCEPGRCFGPQEPQSLTCKNTVIYQVTIAVTDEQGQGTRAGTRKGRVGTPWQLAGICLKPHERYIQKLSEMVGWQFAAAGGPTRTGEDMNQRNVSCYCCYSQSGLRGQQDVGKLKVARAQMLHYTYNQSFIH